MNTNILILSCGTRNKIVQYFKNALTAEDGTRTGNVIATDMSSIAPALYEADIYYIVPKITSNDYFEVIFDICRREKITAVLSLIDPELSLIAQHEKEFNALGTMVVGSHSSLCDLSLNKIKMYEWLTAHGYKTARSYIDKQLFLNDMNSGLISYPVFVKPICGSASVSVNKVGDTETLELLYSNNTGLMIQEYMRGQEIGVDVYVDMISGKVVSIFTKKKIVMRAGETDKAISFKEKRLFEFIKIFVEELGFRGQIDIDLFENDGEYYISEVNPRFGGGYPHAYECGCNHMRLIINNIKGISNPVRIGEYQEEVYMMKYNEIMLADKRGALKKG